MGLWSSPVRSALRRWRSKGLIGRELAERLEVEVTREEERFRRRFGQIVVAGTGGVVFLVAVGIFLGWSWPTLSAGGRTAVLAAFGVGIHSLGALLQPRSRLRFLSYVLQGTGLAVLLTAFGYSERAWSGRSLGGILVGILALVTPVALFPLAVRRDPVMPAVDGAFGYAFVFVFLRRGLGLDMESSLWALDGLAVGAIALLLARLGRAREEEGPAWELGTLLVSLYAGLVLTFLTGAVALELGEEAVWPVDLWLGGIVALTLWAIHGAPERLRRPWYPRQLAGSLLLAIPMTLATFAGSLDASAWISAAALGVLGGAGLTYGLAGDYRDVVIVSCLSLVVGAWFLAVEMGDALAVAGALAFTAALLFWVSARLGGSSEGHAAEPPAG